MSNVINIHGDERLLAGDGRHGVDVAIQRADDLDMLAIKHIKSRSQDGLFTKAVDFGCGSGGQVFRMAQAGANVLGVDITDASDFRNLP